MEDRLTIKIKYTCKCGNENPDKFLLSKGKGDKAVNLLCLFCEKRYDLQFVSKELE